MNDKYDNYSRDDFKYALDNYDYAIAELKKENEKLKKELKKYSSYKTDDERIKGLQDVCGQWAEENAKLQEQLKNAIIFPKNFNVGQKVFMIPTSSNCLKKITAYKILSFSKSDIGLRADLSIVEKEKGIQPYFSADFGEFNTTIFKTEVEAQKYLEEHRNAKI